MVRKIPHCVVLIFVAYLVSLSTAHSSEPEENVSNSFSLGIVPQQSAKRIHALWSPLTKYIQQQTTYPLFLHGSPDIPAFEDNLFTGKFDLAYVNPRTFIEANKHVGYLPLVREGNKKLQGIIVVAKDSPYKTLRDLNGARFTSPKNAFAASTLTRLNMHAEGIKFVNSFVETHTHGYSLVANGAVDAAGGVLRTFNSLNPQIKNRLRILWTSKGVTPHAFIIHPRVNATVKQRILDAILSFNDTPEGIAFFKSLHMTSFVEAQNKDWDDVRQLMGL